MPHPYPLASVFTGGMRRDVDRTELPGGSAYNLLDFIPDEIQAVTGGRGGWTYAGPAMTSPTTISNIGYHSAVNKILATDGANLWNVTAGGATLGAVKISSLAKPAYVRGYLLFGATASGGVPQSPYAYKDDNTIVQFAGAPSAAIPGVYKDHALLARKVTTASERESTTASLNRLWFSAAGDPTTWDLTYGWWDTTGTITGLATTVNSILIFHADSTERLRGTTPPPGSDMVLEMFLPKVGCIDAQSIAYWQGSAIFASPQGVYMTDGVSSVDLTASAELKTYWQSIISGYANGWRVNAGIYRDHYIVSINNGTTLVDCLCFSLTNRTAWRFTNLNGSSFVNVQVGQAEKLYMGLVGSGRVAELSSLWSPGASVKQDADGTTPTPIVETGMFRGWDRLHRRWIESMGKQKWRWSYVDYDIRDAASDNPTMTLSYCTDPAGSYTQAGLTLPETTSISRVRRALNPTQGGGTRSQMMGFKIAATGPYVSAKLYTLEGVFEPIDIGAL